MNHAARVPSAPPRYDSDGDYDQKDFDEEEDGKYQHEDAFRPQSDASRPAAPSVVRFELLSRGSSVLFSPQHNERIPVRGVPVDQEDEKMVEMFREPLLKDREGLIYLSTGNLLGVLSEDGSIIRNDGTVVGFVLTGDVNQEEKLSAQDPNAWLESPNIAMPASKAIEKYLYIPNMFNELEEKGGGVSLDGYKTEVKKNKRKAVNILSDVLSPLKEPEEGIYPAGFNAEELEKARSQIEWIDMCPTMFTRKPIIPASELPPDRVCEEFQMFVSICNREIRGESITFLWLEDIRKFIPKEVKKDLGKYLRLFPNLEVMGLVGAGLKIVENMKLKELLHLDLSRNEIDNFNDVGIITSNSSKLRELNLLQNPILKSKAWQGDLPTLNNEFWSVILNLSQLEMLNQKPIPAVSRSRAMEKYAVKSQLVRVPMALWNLAMNDILVSSGMQQWVPKVIEKLELSGHGLRSFNVGMMDNLKYLNLSNNFIASLTGCGLEQCKKLYFLDLRDNLISEKPKEGSPLKPIRYLTSLKQLFLTGNPLKEYHSSVIHLTSHLKGTNRSPGLYELDGTRISIEERVKAFQIFSKESHDIHRERWSLNMINVFGNLQIRSSENFFSKVKQLKLADRALKEVYLEEFVSLEVLDLSQNSLSLARGLENLRELQIIDLSENPPLSISKTLKQLKVGSMKNLISVNILHDRKQTDHKLYLKMLNELSNTSQRLESINGTTVEIEDRVAVYSSKIRNLNVTQYKVHLALTMSATDDVKSYHPNEVGVGMQYRPGDVLELLELSHLSLTHQDIDFSPFIHLQKLNIANNKITDILAIGLENLSKLVWLDVRNCKINNSPNQVAGLIDRLVMLEVLAIRGNPCMHNKQDRMKILKSISRVQDLNCSFRVLDTEITVAERIEAWSARGDAHDEPEVLQYKAAIKLRAPINTPDDQILGLDLSDVGLTIVELSRFSGLKKLRLNKNKLTSLNGTGIDKLRALTVLDLRDNNLFSVEEIVNLVAKLKNLEYLGISGNRLSHGFRNQFLHLLPSARTIENRLRFIDDSIITVDEILDNIDDEFRDKSQSQRFRWDIALRRQLSKEQILTPLSVNRLSLSNYGLSYILLSWYTKLEELDLSRNKVHNEDLKVSGLEKLTSLRILDLSSNSLHHLDQLVDLLSKLPSLESVSVIGNKCFPEDSAKYRSEFLRTWNGVGSRGFKLKYINGVKVDEQELLSAVQDVLSEKDAQRIKMNIFVSGLKDPDNIITLDLSEKGFSFIDGIQKLRNIQDLDISHNKITSLSEQFLHELPLLRTLTISHNSIESIEDIVSGLSQCHLLKHLEMVYSTKDPKETRDPGKYVEYIGSHLRGVDTIDEIENPCKLSSIQKEAQEWLFSVAQVGPNSLVNVNISNRNLEVKLFFLILCALQEMGSVRTITANGNHWNKGKERIRSYRQYVIYGIGSNLKVMDGEKILDDERLNAMEMVQEEEKCGVKVIKRGGWLAHRDEAKEAADQVLKEREERKAKSGPDLFDAGDRGAREVVGVNPKSAGISGNVRVDQAIASVTGTVLNKFEIIINFLQVLALVLVVDVTIPWPQVFIDFSWWIRFFSFDIDWAFSLDLPYKQEIKFLLMTVFPLFFLILYTSTTRVSIQRWKDRYSENWPKTRTTILSLWFVLMLFITVMAFLLYPESITSVQNGGQPSANTNGILLVIGGAVSLMFLAYLLIIQSFRKHFIGVDNEAFEKWWFKKLYQIRKLSLFMLTVLFMPVTRIILLQFECNSTSKRLTVYPSRLCPNEQWYPIQFAAIILGVGYIIGIPFFFRKLIRTAVKMVDSHGYGEEQKTYFKMLQRKAEKDPEGRKSKHYKKLNKETKEHLREYYFYEVKTNPMPQTYLYAAYERRFRYFKIYQMFQKLIVVLITMFIPSLVSFLKVSIASGVLATSAIVSVSFRPFNDSYEDWMDILSQGTNTINMFVAMLLKLGWSNSSLSGGFLIVINLVTLSVFMFFVFRGILKKYRKKSHKESEGKEDAKGKANTVRSSVTVEMQKFLEEDDREKEKVDEEKVERI